MLTLVFLGVSLSRYYDAYRILANTPLLTLIVSIFLMMETVIMFLLSKPWGSTWWLAHNLYLITFLTVGLGLWISQRSSDQLQFFNVARQIEDYVIQLKQSSEEMTRLNEKLDIMAHKDSLTGLANRNLFYDRVNILLSRARRYSSLMGLMFVDLDDFKKVNDSFGHDVGDGLLKEVAIRLEGCIREIDTVAEWEETSLP